MSTKIGRAVLELAVDGQGLSKSLDGVERRVDAFGKNLQMSFKDIGRIGQQMQFAGAGLTAALTVPLLGVGAAAVKMAADTIESESLFNVALKDMAAGVRAWSDESAEALGLNAFELRKSTGLFFAMFDAMGVAKQGAVDMAEGLTMLAHDMASFFNMDPEEAFVKLRAGITGETEPLKQLGILVDQATVKQYALSAGLIAAGQEMSSQVAVQARYLTIMAQTKDAQGDLARTIESPTNQLRIMKTQIAAAANELGMALMPAIQSAIPVVRECVANLRAMAQWFGSLPESVRTGVTAVAGFAAALGPVLFVGGSVARAISSIAGALPLLTTGLSLATGGATAFGFALRGMLGPIGLAITAFGLLVAASQKYHIANERTVESIQAEIDKLREVGGAMALSRAKSLEDELAKRKSADAANAAAAGHDELSDKLKKARENYKDLIPQVDKAAGATKKQLKAVEDLQDGYKELHDTLETDGLRAWAAWGAAMAKTTEGYDEFWGVLDNDEWMRHNATVKATTEGYDELNAVLAQDEWKRHNDTIKSTNDGYKELNDTLAADEWRRWADNGVSATRTIGDAFNSLGSLISGSFVEKIRAGYELFKDVMNNYKRSASSIGESFNGDSGGYGGGSGNVGNLDKGVGVAAGAFETWDATGQGTTGARAGKGAVSGAKTGSYFGPIGTGIGAGIGALVGWLRGRSANSVNNIRDSALKEWTEISDLDAASDKIRELGFAAGVSDEEMRALFSTNDVEQFKSIFMDVAGQINYFNEEQAETLRRLKEELETPVVIPITFGMIDSDSSHFNNTDMFSPGNFKSFEDWSKNWLGRNPNDEHRLNEALGGHQFATGGIAMGPTYGVFGEAGPEAVIPLDRLDGMLNRPVETSALERGIKGLREEFSALRRDFKLMPTQMAAAAMARG